MQGKSEPGPRTMLPESVLTLGLVLKRHSQVPGQRALLAALPFLALGGRWPPYVRGAVRGSGGQQTMPWLAPRWFGWGGRAVSSANTRKDSVRASHDVTKGEPQAEARQSPDRPLEMLGALAPVLCRAGRGLAATTHARRVMPALIWQPPAGLASAQGRPSPFGSARPGSTTAAARASASSRGQNQGSEDPLRAAGEPSRPATAGRTADDTPVHSSLAGKSTPEGPGLWIQRQPARAPGPAAITAPSDSSLAERVRPRPHPAQGAVAIQPEASAPHVVGGAAPDLRAAAPAWGLLSMLPGLAVRREQTGSSGIGPKRPTPGRIVATPVRGLPTMLPGLAIRAVPSGPVEIGTVRPTPPQPQTGDSVPTLPRGTASSSLPGAGLKQQEGPARQALPATPPLPKRKVPGPGPYAANPLQTLQVVASNVERLVERHVARAVRGQREEMQKASQGPDAVRDPVTAMNLASDEVARLLLQKMQGLAQEERFRRGQLG